METNETQGRQVRQVTPDLQTRLVGSRQAGDEALSELLCRTIAAIDPEALKEIAGRTELILQGSDQSRILHMRLLGSGGAIGPAVPVALAETMKASGKRLGRAAGESLEKMGAPATNALPVLREVNQRTSPTVPHAGTWAPSYLCFACNLSRFRGSSGVMSRNMGAAKSLLSAPQEVT